MELDKRIIKGKKPLTCFDLKEAEEYVGKKCYISNEYDFFRDLDFTQQKILNGVEDCEAPFHYDSDKQAEFCLPEEWVKEPEKKYRPYTKHEFLNKFECGKPINIRRKDDYINFFIETMPSVKIDNLSDDVHVRLFEGIFNLKRLFDEFEWQKSNGEWQPFGVLDE